MPWPPNVRFYLDECFPEQIARALSSVGYPITWPDAHQQRGMLDPDLVPWLAREGFTWVTRDAAAKRAHGHLIRTHRVSVLWVRGIGRDRVNAEHNVTMHDAHLMLTSKLGDFAEKIAGSRSPKHGMVYLNVSTPKLVRVDLDQIATNAPLKIVGNW